MNKLDKYTIDYIDNGVEHFTTILAHSEGMAEDVFYETYGENMDIVQIVCLTEQIQDLKNDLAIVDQEIDEEYELDEPNGHRINQLQHSRRRIQRELAQFVEAA